MSAQLENSKWLIRNQLIDFSSGQPIISNEINQIYPTIRGYSVVCDYKGNLLFYTDGRLIWNNLHQIMSSQLSSFIADSPVVQTGWVVQSHNTNSKYYIFSLNSRDTKGELYVTEIDMQLNNGLGDVVPNSIQKIGENFTGQLFIQSHPLGGIWLIVHKRNDNIFHSFRFLEGEIIEDVMSESGSELTTTFGDLGTAGSIKVNSNNILALSTAKGLLEFHTFSPCSGKIDFLKQAETADNAFSRTHGEFSNSGDFYYMVSSDLSSNMSTLEQYDLRNIENLNDTIPKTIFDIPTLKPLTGGSFRLQIAIDRNIYMANSANNYFFGRINEPDFKGDSCLFDLSAFPFNEWNIVYSIPQPLVKSAPLIDGFFPTDLNLCKLDTIEIKPLIDYENILWSDGSKDSLKFVVQDTMLTAQIVINGCFIFDSISIQFHPQTSMDSIFICSDVYQYDDFNYSVGSSFNVLVKGTESLCDTLKSFYIAQRDFIFVENEILVCSDTSSWFYNGKYYFPGDTILIKAIGNAEDCDTTIHSIIKSRPPIQVEIFGKDTICFGEITELSVSGYDNYLWNTGSEQNRILAEAGVYEVKVKDLNGCIFTMSKSIFELEEWDLTILADTIHDHNINEQFITIGDQFNRVFSYEIIPYISSEIDSFKQSILIPGNVDQGKYQLIFKDIYGCEVSREFTILNESENNFVYNNIFSKSTTLLENNKWTISIPTGFEFENVRIFDRWGNIITTLIHEDDSWDGSFRNNLVSQGVYSFVLVYLDNQQIRRHFVGSILVVD